jgi:hypothetical protein
MRIYFATFLVSLFLCVPAFGQGGSPTQDSVTVSVEALQNLKNEFKILENKVEVQDSIIVEQTRQIELYEKRTAQTKKIEEILKKRLKIRDDRIKMRDERIDRLEKENTWEKIKRYIWTGGALLIGFFVGIAL